jgi:acyl-CoA synthetase (AMP-forming)/AMP-acid ligase II
MPHTLTAREARHYLALLPPDLVVAEGASAAIYRDAGATDIVDFGHLCAGPLTIRETPTGTCPPDARMLQFTSGSTGRPRGALITEQNLLANLAQSRDHLEQFAGKAAFCPLPQFHAMGGAVALEHLCSASPIHYANRFEPASDIRRMIEHDCRVLLSSPNYIRMLLRLGLLDADQIPTLTDFVIGTAPVSTELIADLRSTFPGARIHVRYGLSEAVGTLARLTIPAGHTLPTARMVGAALDGIDLVLRDGELCARAGSCAAWQLDEDGCAVPLLDGDGFLATGDVATIDTGGTVVLRGRRGTFLKVNGYRVDPAEIESVLRELPGVGEVVIIGIPDVVSGQRIVACLEPARDRPCPDARELQAQCRRGLSTFKLPARFEVFDRLPRTPAGKPDRDALGSVIS